MLSHSGTDYELLFLLFSSPTFTAILAVFSELKRSSDNPGSSNAMLSK